MSGAKGYLRVMRDPPARADWNMAVDEALLLAGSRATLRFYGWSPHAISLGYFQAYDDFADVAAVAPIVRRLTGGGAIHHADEVTFSLTIDGDLLPGAIAESYAKLHDAVVLGLAAAGVPARRLTAGPPAAARPKERWCFAEPGLSDIVTDRGKLVGTAQRRVRTPTSRVLHHGSLVLEQPRLTPLVAAIADLPNAPRADNLVGRIAHEVGRWLDLDLRDGSLTSEERSLAERLAQQRYATSGWNRRR